jgi:formate-dependent phosphoribosylglycinamide formyltransferase (GAR transformylase)
LPVPVVKPVEVDSCVYVFEKDSHVVPPAVRAALNTLNRRNVLATLLEDDVTDGDGDIPEQYKLPLEAARKAGLPCLVVMAGGKVLRVVTNPTAEQIAEVGK